MDMLCMYDDPGAEHWETGKYVLCYYCPSEYDLSLYVLLLSCLRVVVYAYRGSIHVCGVWRNVWRL